MRQATIQDLIFELWLRQRNSSNISWITRDNTNIPINEMSNKHLVNAIKMLYRRSKKENDFNEVMATIDDIY